MQAGGHYQGWMFCFYENEQHRKKNIYSKLITPWDGIFFEKRETSIIIIYIYIYIYMIMIKKRFNP